MANEKRRQITNQHVSRTDFNSSRAGLHVVQLDATGSITNGGGTEYTDGDVDATPTGGAVLFVNSSNTLRVASTVTPFPVANPVSDHEVNSTLSTGAWTASSAACILTGWEIGNTANADPGFVQLFDASTITLGTTAPDYIIPVSAGAVNVGNARRLRFATGLVVAATETATGSSATTNPLVASLDVE